MKSKLLLLPPILFVYSVSAQLMITTGAQFFVTGNTQLTIQNTNLLNNGNFTAGSGMVSFTGNTSSFISGAQPIQFNELEINKNNNSAVLLERSIAVGQRVLFTAGFLELNGFNTDLGTTGHLDGEKENTHITGADGGEVLFNVNLNFPTFSNPGNLGVFITANQNLGNVTIKRGHQSQQTSPGSGKSILRYYDILPANNTNITATLRFKYLDAELNGLDENSLLFLQSQNNLNWTGLGFTSRDVVANFAEKTGISSFERFTLSGIENALPVRFSFFNANCETGNVILTWKTAQEQNSHHFDIEKSGDGIRWTVLGKLAAAGSSTTGRTYSFSDNTPTQNNFYRIAEYDLDGKAQYSSAVRTSCNITEALALWPNPVHSIANINIVTSSSSHAMIKIFDSKGSLVKIQRTDILAGANRLRTDMESLANGIYQVSVSWNNGQTNKTVRVIKN